MTRSVVADWHGARAVVACIAFAPVALPLVLLAPAGIPVAQPLE
jgi:hypothetical protein